ncbi:MAG: gamma-glutamyltransferase [Chloroflexi bacterium]|nr:gamma-glutamyltransferase [Chloroflexota bacterium]
MTGIQMGNWQFTKPEVKAEHGVVTAKRPAVAQVGLDILQQGGNAIDAAVAMAFAIDVVEPPMTGIGGGGFLTVSLANGESYVVDFFPTAPGGATPDMYELTANFRADKLGFTGIKDNANAIGARSVGIPGAVAGPLLALERWGKLSRETVLAPAINLAREGHEITWYETLHSANHLDILLRNPEAARLYLRNGKPLLAGAEKPNYLKLPELADTLEIISREGAAGFYRGEIAEKIVAELQKEGCQITLDDLANYQALVKEPLKLPYLGTELLLLPGGTGGPTIAEIVNILEGWDLGELGNTSPEYLHLLIETCKLVLADRLTYLADELPGQATTIPWREIASKEFAATRRSFIKEKAAGTYEPGNPFSQGSTNATYQSSADSCTTYLSSFDAEGNAVALTQTLNGYYGSGVAVPGTGIVLNNAMVLFDPRPGQVNSIAPGKRPLSSMAHFIAREPGGRNLALAGANGGRKIIDTVAQVLLNMLAFDLGAQAACGSPFIDPNGEVTLVDRQVGEATLNRLKELGHKISPQTATVWPRLSANPNAIKRQGQYILGGSEIFTPSVAAGY